MYDNVVILGRFSVAGIASTAYSPAGGAILFSFQNPSDSGRDVIIRKHGFSIPSGAAATVIGNITVSYQIVRVFSVNDTGGREMIPSCISSIKTEPSCKIRIGSTAALVAGTRVPDFDRYTGKTVSLKVGDMAQMDFETTSVIVLKPGEGLELTTRTTLPAGVTLRPGVMIEWDELIAGQI